MQINLTDKDVYKAVLFTRRKQDEVLQLKQENKYYLRDGEGFEKCLTGYLGEIAVAKYFNLDFQYKKYNKKDYDVLGYEVRATYWNDGCLLTHLVKYDANTGGYVNDKPGLYILVTINKRYMIATIRGWRDIADCNANASNWDTTMRYPCFKTPQYQLHPMNILPLNAEVIAHRAKLAS